MSEYQEAPGEYLGRKVMKFPQICEIVEFSASFQIVKNSLNNNNNKNNNNNDNNNNNE